MKWIKSSVAVLVAAILSVGVAAQSGGTMAKDSMSKDAMAPTTLSLTSASVDLSKHLGHKVSVTGAHAHDKGTASLAVKSLKMVAASCS